MEGKKTTGIIIGKFAPLHRGHRYLIENALERVEHLIVLVYDVPKLTKVPVGVRIGWIKKLYPSVEVINAGIGPKEFGSTPEINRLHTDYAKSRLPQGIKIDYVFSSEDYGEVLAEALGAENVLVDKERVNVPVSAGRIRAVAEDHRHYLEDFVYADISDYDKP
jgi:cytidyltransferase-like protein